MLTRRELIKRGTELFGAIVLGGAARKPVRDAVAQLTAETAKREGEAIPAKWTIAEAAGRPGGENKKGWLIWNGRRFDCEEISLSIGMPTDSYMGEDGYLVHQVLPQLRSWDIEATFYGDIPGESAWNKEADLQVGFGKAQYRTRGRPERVIVSPDMGNGPLWAVLFRGNGGIERIDEEQRNAQTGTL